MPFNTAEKHIKKPRKKEVLGAFSSIVLGIILFCSSSCLNALVNSTCFEPSISYACYKLERKTSISGIEKRIMFSAIPKDGELFRRAKDCLDAVAKRDVNKDSLYSFLSPARFATDIICNQTNYTLENIVSISDLTSFYDCRIIEVNPQTSGTVATALSISFACKLLNIPYTDDLNSDNLSELAQLTYMCQIEEREIKCSVYSVFAPSKSSFLNRVLTKDFIALHDSEVRGINYKYNLVSPSNSARTKPLLNGFWDFSDKASNSFSTMFVDKNNNVLDYTEQLYKDLDKKWDSPTTLAICFLALFVLAVLGWTLFSKTKGYVYTYAALLTVFSLELLWQVVYAFSGFNTFLYLCSGPGILVAIGAAFVFAIYPRRVRKK